MITRDCVHLSPIFILIGGLRGIAEACYLSWRYPIVTSPSDVVLLFVLLGVASSLVYFAALLGALALRSIGIIRSRPLLIVTGLFLGALLTDGSYFLRKGPIIALERPMNLNEGSAKGISVLLITIDTLRADHLPAYGYSRNNAPFLASLARRGQTYRDCVTTAPATTPAHVSIMTGTDPEVHGSRFNAVPLLDQVTTWPSVYREAGYRTAAFVSAYPVYHTVSGLQRGFGYYNEFLVPDRGPQLLYASRLLRPLFACGVLRPAERKANMTLAHALAWFQRYGRESYFVWCHFYDPHMPYDPPAPFERMFTSHGTPGRFLNVMEVERINEGKFKPDAMTIEDAVAHYDGEIAFVDRQIERLVRKLAELRGAKPLLVIVTGDHGESLTEHDYFFSHSRDLYHPSLNVPLLCCQLPLNEHGTVVPDSIDLSGIIETLASPRSGVHFKDSEAPLKTVPSLDEPAVHYAESAEGVYISAHEPAMEKLFGKTRSLIGWPWKLIRNPNGALELYNLEHDPGEASNVAERYPILSSTMNAQLEQRIARDKPAHQNMVADQEVIDQLRKLGYLGAE